MTDKPVAPSHQSMWSILLNMVVLLPATLIDANARCRKLEAVFQSIIDPLLSEYFTDPQSRATLRARLLPTAVKGAFLIGNFARITGEPFSPALGLLAGAFARIYDDLFDRAKDLLLDERIATLYSGGIFSPSTNLEGLFLALYQQLEGYLPRASFSVCYEALQEAHRYQRESRKQFTPHLPTEELRRFTALKGAKATVVLYGMVKHDIKREEQMLVEELGSCFQHIDDFEDVYDDRGHGVRTLATQGQLSLRELGRRLSYLAPQFQHRYGRKSTRLFVVGLYYWLCMVLAGRVLKVLGMQHRAGGQGKARYKYYVPIQLLF